MNLAVSKNISTLFRQYFLYLGAASLISACGQDRNLNDHRTAQVELELAKYRSIQGTYRGLAYQTGSKKPLGELEVQLFANTVVDSDGLRREPRPVLQSYVTLRVPGLPEILVSMDTGFYLPQEKTFKTSSNAVRSAITRTLQLEGDIKGNNVVGGLSVFGYPNSALEIDLEKNAEWPGLRSDEFAKDRFPYIAPKDEIVYTGKAFYSTGKTQKTTLTLKNNSISSAGMLVDILSPSRIFTGLVDFVGVPMRITFASMTWDTEANKLSGESIQNGIEVIEKRVECSEEHTANTQTWKCTYTSSLGGTLTNFEFSRRTDKVNLTPKK